MVARERGSVVTDPPVRDWAAGLRPSGPVTLGLLLTVVCVIGGCSADWHVRDADREVNALLDTYQQRVLADRPSWVRQPRGPTSQPAAESDPADTQPTDAAPVTRVDLPTALRIAFTSSRDFLDQQEGLYLSGLGFTLTRYNFGPILNGTIAYLWNAAEGAPSGDSLSSVLGANQILHSGAQLSGSAGLTGSRPDDPEPFGPNQDFVFDSTLRISLRQPLLRGAGYEASHEGLTQGERNLIYAVRGFELFRQDFSIRIADAFYRLVGRKTRLANDERNYRDAVYDRNKAEALRQVDRNRDEDVFLARRREITAEDDLLVARTDYDLALDDFKITLGLPTSTEIEIVDDEPEFESVRIDPRSAVAVGLENRLDLHTERDRLEDDERQVRLARNALLPDFDLSLDYALANATGPGDDATPSRGSGSIGVSLEIPLDRKGERNAYRAARLALQRARRDYQRRLDEVERDILNQLRELEQTEKRIRLQEDQIEFERRAVTVTQFRVEAGDVDNRDLLEARQALTDFQNALVGLKVRHFIARLRLRRDLGVLFVDQEGMWVK